MSTSTSAPIVAWGEVLWDRFPTGDVLGGAPANVAYHLAALGANVGLVTRIGDDADGRRARDLLEQAGVNVSLVQIDSERATGEVGVEIAPGGDAIYTLFRDRAWERIACGAPERARLAEARAFIYGTLAQRDDAGRRAHRKALSALSDGAARICDPNLRKSFDDWELLREALAAATVVKINDHEARTIEDHLHVSDAIRWLQTDCGVDLVALTHGAEGCTLIRGTELANVGGVAAPAGGDNVGCGDAFVAVLTLGVLSGAPLGPIASAACAYASFVAGHRGATPAMPPALVAKTLAALEPQQVS